MDRTSMGSQTKGKMVNDNAVKEIGGTDAFSAKSEQSKDILMKRVIKVGEGNQSRNNLNLKNNSILSQQYNMHLSNRFTNK